jgi:hypothetical protein
MLYAGRNGRRFFLLLVIIIFKWIYLIHKCHNMTIFVLCDILNLSVTDRQYKRHTYRLQNTAHRHTHTHTHTHKHYQHKLSYHSQDPNHCALLLVWYYVHRMRVYSFMPIR